MIGIYFSGTGNTKFCVERFLQYYGDTIDVFPVEEERAITALCDATEILNGYPVYYSNLPKIVRDFITKTAAYLPVKNIHNCHHGAVQRRWCRVWGKTYETLPCRNSGRAACENAGLYQ